MVNKELTDIFEKQVPSMEIVIDKLIFEEDKEINNGTMLLDDLYGQFKRIFDLLYDYKEQCECLEAEKIDFQTLYEEMQDTIGDKDDEIENRGVKIQELTEYIEELEVEKRNLEMDVNDMTYERDALVDEKMELESKLDSCERGY